MPVTDPHLKFRVQQCRVTSCPGLGGSPAVGLMSWRRPVPLESRWDLVGDSTKGRCGRAANGFGHREALSTLHAATVTGEVTHGPLLEVRIKRMLSSLRLELSVAGGTGGDATAPPHCFSQAPREKPTRS